jgi:glutathione S-transferase
MLRILGRSSSINVRKVLWLCEELGLAFEQEHWGTGFRDPHEPDFLALNPNALVPVLVDGETVLWESNTICRYLAASRSRSDLLPADPQGRARVEQWMDWQVAELNRAWSYAFMALVRKSPSHTDAAAIEASIASWHRHMAILDAQLARSSAFVAGATFTLADIVLGLSTQRWFATPMQRPSLPAVEAYYERLTERPGFRLHGRNGMP